MNDKILKVGYELAIRLLFFFIVGIVVTTALSYDPLTGVVFWARATNYCYALMLGMIAVLVMGMAFAPKQCLEVWKELIHGLYLWIEEQGLEVWKKSVLSLYLWIKGKISGMSDIKEITIDEPSSLGLKPFVELVQKLIAKVETTNLGEEIAMKHLQDGLETATFCLEERQEGDTDPETGLPLTWGMRDGKPHLWPTVVAGKTEEKSSA